MDSSLIVYNSAAGMAYPCLPALWLGARLAGRWGELWPRLGLYRAYGPPPPGPRVWLQAVSVGEVGLAKAVADEIWRRDPHVWIAVTTSTAKGLQEAERLFGGDPGAAVLPFPLDVPWAVAAAYQKIRPQVYASLETEVWPNLLAHLKARGAACLMINGRFSPRSQPGYRKVRWLVAPALRRFDALSMISGADRERALDLGAPAGRISVDGNAKYAGLLQKAGPDLLPPLADALNLSGAPLLVAGSARSGEEGPVLEAFARVLAQHPDAVLAVAPRHVERAPRWTQACAALGLRSCLWSALGPGSPRPKGARVVIVDAMGKLMGLYGLCAAAFVGASLVELGGQNPMEPAAWGRPVAHGPDMADFLDAASALGQAGASCQVDGAAELAAFWQRCLQEPAWADQAGSAGREVVSRWSGAAQKAAELVLTHLYGKAAA